MRSCSTLCWAFLLLLASTAQADLAPKRSDWSDLSRFVTLATATSSTVAMGSDVDWGDLPARGGVAWFDPPATATESGIAMFVQEGGRLLLAAERDASAAILSDFGLSLDRTPGRADRFRNHRALLAVRPARRTSPLFRGVDSVVTNRPRALRHRDGIDPVAVFSEGTPFGYHLKFGAGEVLVLADASVFINSMMEAEDNARLAEQIVQWLGNDGAGPIWIVGGAEAGVGRYGDSTPGSFAERANQTLGRIGQNSSPDRALVILLLTLILAAALVFVMGIFPGGQRPTSMPWRSHYDAVAVIEGRAGQPGGPADPKPGPERREDSTS